MLKQSTNMLEPAVVRWSMWHHLPDPIASASYQSALCYACYPFCSGGSRVPAQQGPHRCHMTAMRALQMRRWDGQLARKPGVAITCIRDAQHSHLQLHHHHQSSSHLLHLRLHPHLHHLHRQHRHQHRRQHRRQHQLLCQSSQHPVAHLTAMLAMMNGQCSG